MRSKYADDRVAYTNGKQDMIDIILNCKQIVDMNCQDWYIIQKNKENIHMNQNLYSRRYMYMYYGRTRL